MCRSVTVLLLDEEIEEHGRLAPPSLVAEVSLSGAVSDLGRRC